MGTLKLPNHPLHWQQLEPSLRQQLCQVLSLLLARRLLPIAQKEVEHEPQ